MNTQYVRAVITARADASTCSGLVSARRRPTARTVRPSSLPAARARRRCAGTVHTLSEVPGSGLERQRPCAFGARLRRTPSAAQVPGYRVPARWIPRWASGGHDGRPRTLHDRRPGQHGQRCRRSPYLSAPARGRHHQLDVARARRPARAAGACGHGRPARSRRQREAALGVDGRHGRGGGRDDRGRVARGRGAPGRSVPRRVRRPRRGRHAPREGPERGGQRRQRPPVPPATLAAAG